ncbi:hypothetical protein ALT785_390069 [Alteromonas infernus]
MSIGRTILDCKLALCHLASDMKYAGAVYEARTYGSVRGMRRKPHPTRYCSHSLKIIQFTAITSQSFLLLFRALFMGVCT